jgi:hypothetical protein
MQIQDSDERFSTRLDSKIESKVESRWVEDSSLPAPSPTNPPRGWQEPLPSLQIVPNQMANWELTSSTACKAF